MRTINVTLSFCPGGTTPNRKGESTWILIQFIRFSRDFSLNFNHQEQHISKIKVQNLFSLQHETYSTWNKIKQILVGQQHMEQFVYSSQYIMNYVQQMEQFLVEQQHMEQISHGPSLHAISNMCSIQYMVLFNPLTHRLANFKHFWL